METEDIVSSGRTHSIIAAIGVPVTAAVALHLGYEMPDAVALGVLQGIGGTALTPDLDTRCVWSKFWLNAFYPYEKAMAHRSFWSHGPVVGIVGRVAYTVLLLSGVALILLCGWSALNGDGLSMGNNMGVIASRLSLLARAFTMQEWFAIYVALDTGCMVHVVSDYISSRWKRLRKKKNTGMALFHLLTFTGHADSGFGWFDGAHYR